MAGTVFGRNPVLVMAVVQTAIGLVAAFGFNMDGGQVAALMAFAAALLGLWTNTIVVPVAQHNAAIEAALWTVPPAAAEATKE